MKRVELYRWRHAWAGRWITTSYQCTEEEIRMEHPEAERVEGTLQVRWLPETREEIDANMRRLSTAR
jgi:hypothetical protein